MNLGASISKCNKAERRKLELHPPTGVAQLVEIRETVQEVFVPKYMEVVQYAAPKLPLFAHVAVEMVLSYGVPDDDLLASFLHHGRMPTRAH